MKYMYSHTHEPKRKDIFAAEREDEEKEVDYFCRALTQRIGEFSRTDRAKFSPRETYQRRAESWTISSPEAQTSAKSKDGGPETRMVFPDAIQHRYFGHVDESFDDNLTGHCRYRDWGAPSLQQIAEWDASLGRSGMIYADTLKIMIIEAAGMAPALTTSPEHAPLKQELIDSLLLLAHHPKVGVHSFVHLGSGHSFGLDLLAAHALRAYIYLNILVALEEHGFKVCNPFTDKSGVEDPTQKPYMGLLSYQRLLGEVADTCDGDAQNLAHWEFFYDRTDSFWEIGKPRDVMANRPSLVEYLKGLWRVLITYDMVLREMGHMPDWEGCCKRIINVSYGYRELFP
ncbi:Brix-domain-containing protein [Apiospora arundinis]